MIPLSRPSWTLPSVVADVADDGGLMKKMIGVREASEVIGVSARTLRGWLAKDPPPFAVVRYGKRCLRLRAEDVMRFVESRTSPAAPPEGSER